MLLCLAPQTDGTLSATPVADASACSGGYIAMPAADYPFQTLTYPEANQLIGAAALLLVLAFLFRLIRKQTLGH